jgi:diguanylate cyclase (GGDEF)-like protein
MPMKRWVCRWCGRDIGEQQDGVCEGCKPLDDLPPSTWSSLERAQAGQAPRQTGGAAPTIDSLTGLASRRAAEEWLAERPRQAELKGEALSIALLDIDDFRGLNDTHGHGFGDLVLRRLAVLMRRATGTGDLAARVGGEEFLLAWPGDGALEAAGSADDLRTRFNELTFEVAGARIGGFTLSAGITQLASLDRHQIEGNLTQGLFLTADQALYQAKQDGGNRVRIF